MGNDSHFNQDDMSSYESSSQQFGSVSEPNMCDVMDSLRFNYEDIRMPWDADGNITAFGEIIGTPDAYTQFWQPQTTGFTSAVVAQRGMVEAFTGEDISEAQLLYEATTNGWLTDAGMSPMDAGNLLELHGIDCHVQMEGATVEDLISELSQGHKVLVGVDSGELLDQDYPLEDFFHQSADRAIWVTGIDTGDPDHPKIIINDSGDPHGAGKEYDLSKFVNAWKDSGFSYVATDNAPAGFHLAASGFDPVKGVFLGIVSYFTNIYSHFQDSLQRKATSETFKLLKENVLQVVRNFLKLTDGPKEGEAAGRIRSELEQYRRGLFRLVVVGEIKKGKSSFINALLGEPYLLPVMSDVATSTVFKVTYGDIREYKVFFYPKNPDERPDTLEITHEQVADYGTEEKNPKNEKGVDFIGIQMPHPLLKSGVVIIDTPGLGGLFREHSEITWRYVPNADAIFFVFDSVEAVASKDEMEYLRKLRKMTPFLFFVQAKIDLVSTEQWQKWRDRNLDIISEQLEVPKDKLIYFPISAELKNIADKRHSPKDLDRSGFSPLLYFFHNKLLRSNEEKLAQSLLKSVAVEAAGIRRKVGDELHILSTKTREGLDVLDRGFVERVTNFEKWRSTEYKQAVSAFQDRSNDLRRDTLDNLQNQLDPSPNGMLIKPMTERLRRSEENAKQLNKGVGALQSACNDMCSGIIFDILSGYDKKMKNLIMETSRKLGQTCSIDIGPTIKGADLPPAKSLHMHFSAFEEARNALYGSTAGAMMATLATSLFFPPAGAAVAIASIIGTIGGALFSSRDLKARRKEEAVSKIQNILVDNVRLVQRQATRQFQTIATDFERLARDTFERASSDTQNELKGKLESIADARKSARDENKTKAIHLKKKLDYTDNLLRTIGRMVGSKEQMVA